MAKRIAVEKNLEPVAQALRDRGYEVIRLEPGTPTADVDAVVVTGLSDDLTGAQTTGGLRFPVIEAKGMAAGDVVHRVQASFPTPG